MDVWSVVGRRQSTPRVRGDDNEAVRANAFCVRCVRDSFAGARGADARDDRNVTTHRLDDGLDHSIAFVAREQRTLPVRPEREDRVDAAVDDEAGVVRGRFHVE
jgi:hypothetical protein